MAAVFPRRDGITILVQHAQALRRHRRNPIRPLELAALLRPRSQAPTRHLQMGDFLPDVPFDPDRYGCRVEPSLDRGRAQLIALEVVPNCPYGCRLCRSSVSRVKQTGRRARHGGGARQLAMGFAFRSYFRCSTRFYLTLAGRPWRHARGCSLNGPRTRFPASF